MTTIFERVKSAMDTISPSVSHALAPYEGATLPDTYIVYQLIGGDPAQNADNTEKQRSYTMQVTIWCKAGLINLPDVKTAMVAAGFIPSTERQLPKDRETGHYGLAKDFVYLE